MDLPNSSYYGVRCPKCPCILWYKDKTRTELRLSVAFKDKGIPYIEESVGIVIGFGYFDHTCRPDLES